MRKYIILILRLFVVSPLFASDSTQYSTNGFGVANGVSNVEFLSPITYNSYVVRFYSQTIKERSNFETNFYYRFALGLHSNINRSLQISAEQDIFLEKRHFINKYKKENEALLIGYAFWYDDEVFLKPNNVNNVLYAKIATKAAFTLSYKKKIGNIRFQNNFAMPLVGLYYGSKYSQNLPGILERESSITDGMQFGSLNMSQMFMNTLMADIKVKHKKKKFQTIRLEYGIEYDNIQLNGLSRRSLMHELKFSTLINKVHYHHEE